MLLFLYKLLLQNANIIVFACFSCYGQCKVQGSRLFVTYTIIQGIISSEMEVRTGPLNGQCKKKKKKMMHNTGAYI